MPTAGGYQPVTYQIGSVPTRIAGIGQPPYTLINRTPSVTIWIADNPGLIAGNALPLEGGTSLRWITPGDFYAICETGQTATLTISDVDQWQPDPAAIAAAILNSGVLIIDNPLRVFSGALSDSAGVAWIDVSRYQSLLVDITCSAVNANGGEFAFLEFSADGIGIKRAYKFEFRDATATGNQKKWTASVPILGAFCRVRLASANIDAVGTIDASNRPAYAINQDIQSGTTTGPEYASFYWDSTTLGATSQIVIGLPPWFGEIELDVQVISAAAMGTSDVQVNRRDPNGGTLRTFRRLTIGATPLPTGFQCTSRFCADGDALQVVINNTTATNWSVVNVRIIPVSGYGAIA